MRLTDNLNEYSRKLGSILGTGVLITNGTEVMREAGS